MVEAVRDGDDWEAWARGDLDEWVGAGRAEASAQERLARVARIAGDHDLVERGAIGGRLVRTPRPRRRRGRSATTALLLVVASVASTLWWTSRPGEPLGQPAPAPAGTGGYAFLDERPDGSGRPVTFDPCKPIHYAVRPDGQPPSGPAMVAAALAEVSRVTGLVFVDDGPTDEAPAAERHLTSRWALRSTASPVLIAWASETEWPSLAGAVVGEAGPVSQSFARAVPRYVTGQVVLDAEDLAHAPGDAAAAEQVRLVLLHELGHLVGLGHVDDPSQLMYAEAGPGLTGFGPGDLRGLHAVGSGECG